MKRTISMIAGLSLAMASLTTFASEPGSAKATAEKPAATKSAAKTTKEKAVKAHSAKKPAASSAQGETPAK